MKSMKGSFKVRKKGNCLLFKAILILYNTSEKTQHLLRP